MAGDPPQLGVGELVSRGRQEGAPGICYAEGKIRQLYFLCMLNDLALLNVLKVFGFFL